MNETLLRIGKLFIAVDRIADLNLLMSARVHFMSFGKLGEQFERAIVDMENRHALVIQRYDNYQDDLVKAAIQKYVDATKTTTKGGK